MPLQLGNQKARHHGNSLKEQEAILDSVDPVRHLHGREDL